MLCRCCSFFPPSRRAAPPPSSTTPRRGSGAQGRGRARPDRPLRDSFPVVAGAAAPFLGGPSVHRSPVGGVAPALISPAFVRLRGDAHDLRPHSTGVFDDLLVLAPLQAAHQTTELFIWETPGERRPGDILPRPGPVRLRPCLAVVGSTHSPPRADRHSPRRSLNSRA